MLSRFLLYDMCCLAQPLLLAFLLNVFHERGLRCGFAFRPIGFYRSQSAGNSLTAFEVFVVNAYLFMSEREVEIEHVIIARNSCVNEQR